MSNNSFQNMINNIKKSDVAIPKGIKENINNDYTLASILSKTIAENNALRAQSQEEPLPDEFLLSKINEFDKISKSTSDRIKSNDDIVDLFPDIEMCVRVLVSSIAAPNDMLKFGLNYEINDLSIPVEVKNNIISVITEYLEKNYKIDSNLYDIIKEALFTKGAYINFILPEASLDDIINSDIQDTNFKTSTESYLRDNKIDNNVRGNNRYQFNFENDDGELETIDEDDIGVYITSDPRHLIKYMSYSNNYKANSDRTRRMSLMLGMEDAGTEPTPSAKDNNTNTNNIKKDSKINDKVFFNVFRKLEQSGKPEKLITVKTELDTSRYSVGKPVIFKLPTESVIPLHLKSDPKSHIGYIVLVNDDGTIVNISDEKEDKKSRINNMTGFGSNVGDVVTTSGQNANAYNSLSLVKKVSKTLHMSHTAPVMKEVEQLYGVILEDLITKKLKNANYIDIVSIKNNTNLFNIMFNRYLKLKKTRVIYIPEELISYIAIDYRTNGTGYSLLEKTRYLNELRSVVMFVRLMNYIRSSIPRSKVIAQLPSSTLDPLKNIADIKTFVYNNRESMFPVGNINTLNPNELRDWYRKLGITFEFKSDAIPDMSIDNVEDHQQYNSIDPEFEQELYKKICMSFGLTTEMIDTTYQLDFAASVMSHNVLFSRYVITLQSKFNEKFTDYIRKLFINDKELIYSVKKIVDKYCEDNKSGILKIIKEMVPEYSLPKDPKTGEEDSEHYVKLASIYIMREISQHINAYLPAPQINENIVQNENIDNLVMGVDKILNSVFDQSILTEEVVGESAKYLEIIKGSIRMQLILNQIRENKAFDPILKYLDNDPDVSTQLNPFESVMGLSKRYNDNIIGNIKKLFNLREEYNDKLNKRLEDFGGIQEIEKIPDSGEKTELDKARTQADVLKEIKDENTTATNNDNTSSSSSTSTDNNNSSNTTDTSNNTTTDTNTQSTNTTNTQPSNESEVDEFRKFIKKNRLPRE